MRLIFMNLNRSTIRITLNSSVKELQPKILTEFDVIVLNLRNQHHNKITIGNPVEQNSECWLSD